MYIAAEYYSAIRKETLPLATIGINLEGIMLSEISQTKKTIYIRSHLCDKSKTTKLIETTESW